MKNLFLSAFVAILCIASQASAAITLPVEADFANTSVETLVGLVLGGLVVMWGARKLIKTVNRS